MACLIKAPSNGAKGVVTLTTQERDKLVHAFPDIRNQVQALKDRYLIGLHHNWHDPALRYDPLFDFHLAGAEDLVEVNGVEIPLIPMDACNFSPSCFYPQDGEKFWDILFVARAVEFKGIPEFFKAIRRIYDEEKILRVLFICPIPPDPGAGILKNVRQLYEDLFSAKEQDTFTLLTMDYRYPFPFDLPTLAHFYRASKIFVHSAPDERRCRVAAYAWATNMPVVGMEAIGSVLSKELRQPPYFYETSTYDDFPQKILEAIEGISEKNNFTAITGEISSSESTELFEIHLDRIYKDKKLMPPVRGGWMSDLDIRLGRHHGIPAGVNSIQQDISEFLDFLNLPTERIVSELKGATNPEEYIFKSKLTSPRSLIREEGPSATQLMKQSLIKSMRRMKLLRPGQRFCAAYPRINELIMGLQNGKYFLRRVIGSRNISKIRWLGNCSKVFLINRINKIYPCKFLNIGAGTNSEMIGWWTDEYQSGFIIDKDTKLPFKDESIEFAYSSMFFEHINDETAENLFKELFRVLRPGGKARIVVPDFELYLDEYDKGNLNFFYNEDDKNFSTWASMGVPLDKEHLLVGMISSIHNLPHQLVNFQYLEDLTSTPPKVCYPFQHRLTGYYCGPAPEMSTELIKSKLSNLPPKDFIDWVLNETSKSKFQDLTFNSWHKNRWDFEKVSSFGLRAGFLKIDKSEYGDSPIQLSPKIEKLGHQKTGLYFNLYK